MPKNPVPSLTAERQRLEEDARRDKNWKRWGPYLSERQWGTVREDYSADGDSWKYFTHEDARSRLPRRLSQPIAPRPLTQNVQPAAVETIPPAPPRPAQGKGSAVPDQALVEMR